MEYWNLVSVFHVGEDCNENPFAHNKISKLPFTFNFCDIHPLSVDSCGHQPMNLHMIAWVLNFLYIIFVHPHLYNKYSGASLWLLYPDGLLVSSLLPYPYWDRVSLPLFWVESGFVIRPCLTCDNCLVWNWFLERGQIPILSFCRRHGYLHKKTFANHWIRFSKP